jgi:hypothetical protein
MQCFKDILPTLSSIEHISSLILTDRNGEVTTLENKPGTSGSVAVYFEVSKDSGVMDSSSATAALELYAEHTEDARENPGKHPNIDRLFVVIDSDSSINIHANKI